MQIIIDINKAIYKDIRLIREMTNQITNGKGTAIQIFDAIENGIPLDAILDKIRAEIQTEYNKHSDEWNYQAGLWFVLEIIDKYRNEVNK